MASQKKQMGFTANWGNPGNSYDNSSQNEQAMFVFDSGKSITFADATHHLLVLGTTGSGKTAQVVLPCISGLIKGGHAGLIIDVKGNMRAQTLELAKRHGREADIIEYGTGPTASRLNLLADANRHRLRSFFKGIALDDFEGRTQGVDWHMKGVNIAADCGQLLIYLSAIDDRCLPTPGLIGTMLEDIDKAAALYQVFLSKVFDRHNEEHANFVASVKANRFHIFHKREKLDKTIEEQTTWNLQAIRMGMRAFLDAPGVRDNFSCPGAPGIEMASALLKEKIVLLRFDLETGPIGARLARLLISSFYSAVYAIGLRRKNRNKKMFVCIDEFQEVADLSGERYSDASFISQARGFGGIFIASTQSMAALVSRGQTPAAVESFVSNCNQRALLYSDDPLTQEMARRYDEHADLKSMEPGSAFVVHYDVQTRRHSYGFESCNQAFESVKDVLDLYEPPGSARREAGTHLNLGSLAADLENGQFAKNKNLRRAGGSKMRRVPVHPIMKRFPEFFVSRYAEINVPLGWRAQVERSLSLFRDSGIKLEIYALSMKNGRLRAWSEEGLKAGMEKNDMLNMLTAMLRPTASLCVLCGSSVSGLNEAEEDSQRTLMPLCPECFAKYNSPVLEDSGIWTGERLRKRNL